MSVINNFYDKISRDKMSVYRKNNKLCDQKVQVPKGVR